MQIAPAEMKTGVVRLAVDLAVGVSIRRKK